MTTTQVNVRAAPSTASASLGLVGIFSKIQIIGKDASGSWYQIVYAESEAGKGWVRAEYVQINSGGEIRLVESAPGLGSAVSGRVTQKVNVRSEPGMESELLGVLNSNDLVSITGRNVDGKWIQIEFAGAPNRLGWVSAELVQVPDIESLPQIGATPEATPIPTVEASSPTIPANDGDSMQSPLTSVVFSVTGSRALQVKGNVSTINGDTEDWVQFTARGNSISIDLICPPNALRAELWNNGKAVGDFPCGWTSTANITPDNDYFLRLIQNETGYTEYVLNLEVIP
jgi:uncharacterized protein YraI